MADLHRLAMWCVQIGLAPAGHDIGNFRTGGDVFVLQQYFQRGQPRSVVIITAIKLACVLVVRQCAGQRCRPVLPAEKPSLIQPDDKGKGGSMPRCLKRAVGIRAAASAGSCARHAVFFTVRGIVACLCRCQIAVPQIKAYLVRR